MTKVAIFPYQQYPGMGKSQKRESHKIPDAKYFLNPLMIIVLAAGTVQRHPQGKSGCQCSARDDDHSAKINEIKNSSIVSLKCP